MLKSAELVASALAVIHLVPGAAGGQPARELAVGRSVTRELARDGVHVYILTLAAGRFVGGDVDQHGANVRVSVYDPTGALVFRNSASERGHDPFQFETEQPGEYRLVIASPRREAGRYSLLVRRDEPVSTKPEERVDQLLSAYGSDSPGAFVQVTQAGKVLFSKGYGLASLAHRAPITADTVFNLASVSKPFTGLAIAQLESKGRLSIDDDVRKYVPELPDFGTPIAIKHLLWHTSGLRDQWSLWELAGGRADDRIRHEDILRLVQRQRTLNFPPGTRYSYSNTNYTLLAETVRRVTGESLGEWLRREVFQPTGMRTAQVVDDADREIAGLATSYRHASDGYRPYTLRNEAEGPSNMLASSADLTQWLAAFADPRTSIGSLQERMTQPGLLNDGKSIPNGYGLGVAAHGGIRSFGHGGSHSGYRTVVRYFPDLQASVIILANVESALSGMWLGKIANAFFGIKDVRTQSPEPPKGTPFPQELRSALLGTYALAQASIGAPGVVVVQGSPDGLSLTFDQQPPIEARAVADGVFRPGTSQPVSLLAFDMADDGTVNGLEVEGAVRARYVKQPAPPNVEQWRACVGSYWSEELETRYDVTLRGDHLVIEHRRHGSTELLQVGKDQFQAGGWIFGSVRFVRSSDEVTGLQISNFGVENLQFDRQRK